MNAEIKTLKDHVYDYIAELIAKGEMSDTEKITEQQVCDALGVSRTPVREALIQLAADGYLESIPRRGFFVQHLSENKAREVIEILGPLDGRAAYLAVPYISDADIEQMHLLQESIDLAIDKGLYRLHDELQAKFHDCYHARCGNQRLVGYIHQLNRFFIRRETGTMEETALVRNLRKANEQHAEIVRLFESRDAAGVQNYIRDVHWSIDIAKTFVW